ncbi:MarR family transcriptional regulator [Paenibacillus sp. MWE-103]|uniref:MarR family transcriptional regulator n=1 Tax=Paenibacillus artemisiicola TaxID=1172618 RepID=A0ABS3WD66_9BACL|nr:MarR family transcriptional regulator [Paenibacillus artemisiicola]MBO7746258.1 MarR family transcriptional regulator [Paenibacillus artemisiicola]
MEDEIRELLYKVAGQLRRTYDELLREVDLHVGQDQLLCQLWREEGVTQAQLCERLNVEPPTVTNMLIKLEKKGIVSRKRDEADGRVSRVYVTPEGRALLKPVESIWHSVTEKLLADFPSEERARLVAMLRRMDRNLE